MVDLRQIAWMRLQWKRFRRLLWGATGAIWLVCCGGVLLAGDDQLLVRAALLLMLVASTACSIRLLLTARRETKALERRAIEMRAALVQEKKAKMRPPHPGPTVGGS